MMSTASLVLAAAVLVLAVYLQPTRHELALLGQTCSEVGSSTAQVNHSTDASCYFHATYRDARAAFRRLATSAGADEQHVLAVDAAADLTVDVAVFQGTGASASRTVVHLSGVHGVEGHCGSSIQLAWLDKRRATKARAEAEGAAAAGDAPTVMLVHVVNPFGMANGRRFNENNVDLNRNFVLDEATWAELLARPPSFGGYAAAYSLFNENADPRLNVVSRNAVYWFITLRDVYLAGFETIKKAFVVGQYYDPNALYFGGTKLEKSLVLLRDFFAQKGTFAVSPKVAVIDVHTGLGPVGVDTILVDDAASAAAAKRMYGSGAVVEDTSGAGKGPAAGAAYMDTKGTSGQGFAQMAGHRLPIGDKLLVATQEFGTVPISLLAAKALVFEHAAWRRAPELRPYYADQLRAAFYPSHNKAWKASIVARGLAVLDETIGWVQEE